MFSLFVRNRDSNMAEIMAIQKACHLCASSTLLIGREIEIINDSKVTVAWVNSEGFGSIEHVDIVYDIRTNLSLLKGSMVTFNSRASNTFVDNLAKQGSSNNGDRISWGDI